MEQYFKAAHVEEKEQVTITSMYLAGDAKLWWRTRTEDDVSAGRPKIETWAVLKKELKDQFLPLNTSYLARESLKNLKQTGSVREYVKEFSSLLLDIKNMSDDDKLFNFLSGLKPWAHAELRRQSIKDLPTAIAAADSLIDYKQAGLTSDADKAKGAGKGNKGNGQDKRQSKPEIDGLRGAKLDGQHPNARDKGCYICGGPHLMRTCPKREKLAAIVVDDDEKETEEMAVRVNPLRIVALRTEKSVQGERLMYVEALVNGKSVMAMIDTGATDSFVDESHAGLLGLRMTPSESKLKAANSEVKRVKGTATVDLKVGAWEGKHRLNVVALDDFDVILGMDFLRMTKCAVMPHLGGIMMEDERSPCFIKAISMAHDNGHKGENKLAATQVLVGEVTCYLNAMVVAKIKQQVCAPNKLQTDHVCNRDKLRFSSVPSAMAHEDLRRKDKLAAKHVVMQVGKAIVQRFDESRKRDNKHSPMRSLGSFGGGGLLDPC